MGIVSVAVLIKSAPDDSFIVIIFIRVLHTYYFTGLAVITFLDFVFCRNWFAATAKEVFKEAATGPNLYLPPGVAVCK